MSIIDRVIGNEGDAKYYLKDHTVRQL